MTERKLARVVVVDNVEKHSNADALDICTIGGWRVVSQKGLYKPGDLACYMEVDSWVPHEIAPFLSKGKEPREFNGVKGERLRTIKLRGEISQGLLIPLRELPIFEEIDNYISQEMACYGYDDIRDLLEEMDLTERLGVQKYEKPLPACLTGRARGNFPAFIRKTDEPRVQNVTREYEKAIQKGEEFEVTYKLDGSSFTAYVNSVDGEVSTGVCSRNLELKTDSGNENNTFVRTFIDYGLDGKLRAYYGYTGNRIAIQGEMVGPGIQDNFEGLPDIQLFIYKVWDIDKQSYKLPQAARDIAGLLGLNFVPLFSERMTLPATVAECLALADGPSGLKGKYREGLVFKSLSREFSFKAISQSYLLKEKD